jgi:putative restriction endonuclease
LTKWDQSGLIFGLSKMAADYDAPFFKRLSRNDTGETGSHQGGIVIPRDLSQFFPHLALSEGPTAERAITAEMYDGGKFIGTASLRYQIQTWGRERSPEHRITRNLQPLLAQATAGDAVLFQRQLGDVDRFRLILLHKGTRLFEETVKGGKFSVFSSEGVPATQDDFKRAEALSKNAMKKPFRPTEPERAKKLSVVQRRVRSELFQMTVRLAYERKCAFCGRGMLTPAEIPEVEAAHIIPRAEDGSNDARNGLALCRSHHWAFDRLLWTVTEAHEIVIPRRVRGIAENARLVARMGNLLRVPDEAGLRPAREATKHHRRRAVETWGKL